MNKAERRPKKRVKSPQNTPRRDCEKPERRKKEELAHAHNKFAKHCINFMQKEFKPN